LHKKGKERNIYSLKGRTKETTKGGETYQLFSSAHTEKRGDDQVDSQVHRKKKEKKSLQPRYLKEGHGHQREEKAATYPLPLGEKKKNTYPIKGEKG